MSNFNHYKEKFWDYSNDELKDIVAGRFKEPSDDEVAAAMALLKERNNNSNGNLSLAQIPSASMSVLLEIIKNPEAWGKDAVAIAEAEILRREQEPADTQTPSGEKTFLQVVLAIVGVIISVVLLKILVGIIIICFFFYSVMSCLDSL